MIEDNMASYTKEGRGHFIVSEENTKIIIVLLVSFLGVFLSKGLSLFPGFSADDYSTIYVAKELNFYLSQGRFVQAAIQIFLTFIGLSSTAVYWPTAIVFMIALSVAIALMVVFITRGKESALLMASAAALIACHPYLTEYFSFRESNPTQSFSFVLLAAILFIETTGRYTANIRSLYFVLLATCLAGTQQTAFLILALCVLARVLNDLCEDKQIKAEHVRLLMCLFISFALYVLIFVIISKSFGIVSDERASLIAASDVMDRLRLVKGLIYKIIIGREPLISSSLKWIVCAIFALLLVINVFSQPVRAAYAVVLLSISIALSIFLVSVSRVWWPVPRAIYGLGFGVGITFLFLSININRTASRLVSVVVLVCAFVLSMYSSSMLYDQLRVNRWDNWVAGGIARDLGRLGVRPHQAVVLVGAGWSHPLRLQSVDGDLNTSALAVKTVVSHVFMEATGRMWSVETIPSAPVCEKRPNWPEPESMTIVDGKAYVCVGTR